MFEIRTDLRRLSAKKHHEIDAYRTEVAGFGVLDIDVSLDFALLREFFGLSRLDSSLV